MTKFMDNFYYSQLKEQFNTTSSFRHLAEKCLMHNPLCRFVAVLLISLNAFSYAQADTSVWDGTYSTSIVTARIDGGGTAISPYQISNAHQLATIMYISYNTNNWSNKKHFRLTNDIDLNGDVHEWIFGMNQANNFRGIFDGAGHTISNMKIVARSSAETGSNTQRYGLFSGLNGENQNNVCEVKNLTLDRPKLIVESAGTTGERSGEHYYGLLAGKVSSWVEISNIKVTSPEITLKCDQTTRWDVGAIASLNGWAHAKNIIVTNPNYHDDGVDHTFLIQTANNTNNRFSVGGVVGFISDDNRGTSTKSDGSLFLQANYITDCAVTGANFNFSHYKSSVADSYQYNNFSVAGVVGSHWYPIRMCENLYFDGKIFAPGAYVVPCVYIGIGNEYRRIVSFFDYEKVNDADRVEKSKSATWYYGDYKIGLSSDFTSTVLSSGHFGTYDGTLQNSNKDVRYINFAGSGSHLTTTDGVTYLIVTPSTLRRQNRYNAVARPSRTILWWTAADHNNNGYQGSFNTQTPTNESDWREGYQNLWPQPNQTVGSNGITGYPSYYMYYAQGVNMGTKHVSSAAATGFVAGLTKNIEVAHGTAAKKVTLSISETAPQDGSQNGVATEVDQTYKEAVRGFVSHNFTITPSGADAAQVDHYKWFVDGAENASTATTLNDIKPSFVINQGWQTGKGINVVAYDNSGNALAQASTYIPLMRLRTTNQADLVANPKTYAGFIKHIHNKIPGSSEYAYLIGCEEELRLMQEQINGEGESYNEALFLDSYHMSNRTAVRSQTSTGYNWPGYPQSYYKLDANINLTTSEPFYPMGPNAVPVNNGDGTTGQWTWLRAFVGEFDGRGYSINGLRQTWYSADGNNPTALWGLFSVIGHSDQYIRAGGSTKMNAVVRNLKLNDVEIKHKTTNTAFYPNNGNGYYNNNTWSTTGWASQVYVGTLAGVAAHYATIENVSVTNASINDNDDTSAYDLAGKRFSVGGLVGRVQNSYSGDGGVVTNAKIRYVASDADIKLTHAKYHNVAANSDDYSKASQWEQRSFLIGGIIGSMHSNQNAENTLSWAAPAIFTGKIQSPNAMAGPVYGLMSWNANAGGNWQDLVKQFTGKTSTTMERDATDMFYNYAHYDGSTSTYKEFNATNFPLTSNYGESNVKQKTNHPTGNTNLASTSNYGVDHDLYEYQGANIGNYAAAESADVLTAFNDKTQVRGVALAEDESSPIGSYKWIWTTNTASRNILDLGAGGTIAVTAKDTYDEKDETPTHKLDADVNTSASGTPTYQWYKRTRVNSADVEQAIDGAIQKEYTPTQNIHNQYFFVKATIAGVPTPGESNDVMVPGTPAITASLSKSGSAGSKVLAAAVSPDLTDYIASNEYSVSYQWYKTKVDEDAEYKISGATSATYNVPAADELLMHYCVVTVVDENAPRSTGHNYLEDNTFTFTLSIMPADKRVVFLDPSNSSENASDDNNGTSNTTPVKSWHKAYSLLLDNGTWDDNIIVLMSRSDRARTSEGFYCKDNAARSWTDWYNRYHGDPNLTHSQRDQGDKGREMRGNFTYNGVTYTMSGYKPTYDNWYNGDMWKNATITGKYTLNDVTYDYTSSNASTEITNKAIIETPGGYDDNMCIYGDTRFEHLTFYGGSVKGDGGNNYDILYCFYNSVEMGDGLVMTHFRRASDAFGKLGDYADNCDFQIFGGAMNDARFKDPEYGGFNQVLMEDHLPHGNEGFEINIKSGFFSVICSSYRQNSTTGAGIIGTPDMPIKCTMNIDIDQTWNAAHSYTYNTDATASGGSGLLQWPMTYDVGMLLAGNHEGAMYGDVEINVYSGKVGRIASGNLGAIRDFSVMDSHYIPLNSFMGRAGILLDPENSRLAATDGKTKNERVIITEIYGGGLGRSHGSEGMINIPFYGHNSITINGGTLKVLQRTEELAANVSPSKVTPGVFATGAGGVNGIYHVDEQQVAWIDTYETYDADGVGTDARTYETYSYKAGALKRYYDEECTELGSNGTYLKRTGTTEKKYDLSVQRLPYWASKTQVGDDTRTARYVAYTQWQTYKTKTGSDKVYVKCYDSDTKSTVSIDPEDTQTILTINDGVFGSADRPIYGVYGGGSGFVSTDILPNASSYPNYRAGNIYAKEGASHPVAQLNINGGEFFCTDGVFGGGRGTDFYFKTPRSNANTNNRGANHKYYTSLGQIYGDVEMNITGGTFHCNVYGGGFGYGDVQYYSSYNWKNTATDWATAYSNPVANTKKTLEDMARIYGTTTVNITGGTFNGNVYGGGAIANVGSGESSTDFAERKSGSTGEGTVQGADNRDLTANGKTYFSIGNKNAITLNISGATIKGKVFGAAQGLSNAEAVMMPDSIGNVHGNVVLNISGSTVYGKKGAETDGGAIYGGAEKGDVYGNATTYIDNVRVGGDIYGAGLGVLNGETVTASADVRGNTYVTLGKGTSYIKLEDESYVSDAETSHYLFGGGNLASVVGKYVDNSETPQQVTTDHMENSVAGTLTLNDVAKLVSGGNTTVNVNNGMGTEQLTVYGAGMGANTACSTTNVNINNFDKNLTVNNVTKPIIGLAEVFGGGNLGRVYTNTNVNMNGGQVFGNVFGGGNLAHVGTLCPEGTFETYGSVVSLASPNAVIWGDIFGGGNQANVSGTAQVSVSEGAFAGQVFGGGKGVMTNDNTVQTPANVIGQTMVYVNGANVQWNKKWISRFDTSAAEADKGTFKSWSGAVSGNNYGWFIDRTEETEGNKTKVTAVRFKNPHNIFGGGYLASVVTDTARVEVTNGAVPAALIKLSVWKMSFSDDANPHFYVFGGGYGPFTQVKATDVTVGVEGYYSDDEDESTNEQWALDVSFDEGNQVTEATTNDDMTIYGNNYGIGGYTVLGVIGGGYAGLVKEDTNVKLGGTTFVHRVYGGGYGHLGEYNKLLATTKITGVTGNIIATDRDRENLGEVGRNTNVRVSLSKPDEKGRTGGVYGDVFGGGAGVESADPADETPRKDFVDMGKVLGFTRVNVVENARVYGSVYGGGDVANVANSIVQPKPYEAYTTVPTDSATIVRIEGGDIFGDVFGGGKGRKSELAVDYRTLGNIAGNTFVFTDTSTGVDSDTNEEITYTPNIWGNIYGGGQIGDINASGINSSVSSNTNILVNGGNIGNNIYGAGEGVLKDDGTIDASADVTGNTNVTVNGGSFLWRKIAGIGGSIHTMTDRGVTKEAALAIIDAKEKGETAAELTALKSDIQDVFDVDKKIFVNDHNIYGGGNTVSTVAGNATIKVNHGMMTEALGYYDHEEWSTGALLYHLISTNNSHPQFSVLGGGYGDKTTISGNTNVTVSIGKTADYDGATDGGATQDADQAIWTALLSTSDGTYKGEFGAPTMTTEVKQRYYGGETGMLSGYVTSRLANNFSIPNHTFMNIVGGGMAGKVTGNATVNISDQSMCHNVFGGGIGIMPTSPTGEETYGQVGGTTTVNITGGIIENNVYGGGAGVESYKDNEGNFTDFPDIAAVDKTTSVSIGGTSVIDADGGTVIFGKVFGGGDVANVKNSATPTGTATTVTVTGGAIYQQVFGGGSGRLKDECNDYTTLGKVTGNTHVTISNADATKPTYLWNRVYGGGSYGSVTGNTTVDIQGGNLGYNIFGGGFGDAGTAYGDDANNHITSSDVGGDTNVNVTGGEWCLWFMWDAENRNWMPADLKSAGVYYTSQYDPVTNKFRINHNIYGGGNAACRVTGSTNVTMSKGMLYSDTPIGRNVNPTTWRSSLNLFEQDEWKNIYNKVGSFHFTVIGGGYGKKTSVGDDTNVTINIPAGSIDGGQAISTDFIEESADVLKADMYKLFRSQQSLLDVVGGGYNGEVLGNTNVTISGDPYIRRIFGGSFYADVNNTNVTINSACADDVFAGGMMGDVKQTANLQIGTADAEENSKILICRDVYGGNDVSGQVNGNINMNIYGGKFYHNIYGAGNGNYLYALNEERTEVTGIEDYEIDGAIYPLVYEVPRRAELMPASASSSSEAARLVNINSYRPLSQFINLKLAGTSSYPVKVLGNVFGGGNTATVTKLDGTNPPTVTVDLGDYVTASQVFMGADGEAMFDESTTGTLNAFKRINNIELSDDINWVDDPYNIAIPQTYLPLSLDDRQKTFPHIIDLYFQPVQMSVQPTLKWNGTVASPANNPSVTGTTIGSFFCGGNRGNMDVRPADDGSVVNYVFPAGLTIKDKIVGGCNNANFVRTDLGVVHEGGYLLGSRSTEKPMISLLVKCNIDVASSLDSEAGVYTSGNVYGGCYKSGTINGDISIDVHSNMVNGLEVQKIIDTNKAGKPAGNVYGGGYGTESYVYGNIKVAFGTSSVACTQGTSGGVEQNSLNVSLSGAGDNKTTDVTPVTINDTGFSANNIYGGGEFGNVIGNTTVKVLNGHIAGNVSGGAYAGVQYGSTQVLVGYPDYYTVNKSGTYAMLRADKKQDNLDLKNKTDNSNAIKQVVRLVQGDIIAPTVYDAIVAKKAAESSNFTSGSVTAPSNWNYISINIGDAVYGGGYSLASTFTGSGGAGTNTVRKYNATYNINNTTAEGDSLHIGSTVGWGGNTTVLIWDDKNYGAEHINIASNEATDGGMFGDGHLSYSEGFRAGELRGYGYATHTVLNKAKYEATPKVEENNAKVLNTIQRFDQLRLTDNCVLLNGARDYTIKEISTTPYSIARIGELQMVSTIDSTATTPFPTVAKARNYVGLMNNIHYVGAIKSSVDFDRKFHDYDGTLKEGYTYKTKKQEYITNFYTAYPAGKKSTSEINALGGDAQTAYNNAWNTFNKRNDATSLNMIGLSSGYAMKVQGTYDTDAVGTEGIYYGPVDGVVEMKLIQPIADEGGGYVYADNVHKDTKNFLESTGNFVFPTSLSGNGQKVVDDCLLLSFDQLPGNHGAAEKNAETSEMHYWFLTGRHYFYNLHITGYTFNSVGYEDNEYVANDIPGIKFNADTSDGLTILEGATKDLVITGIKWNHHHKADGTADTDYNAACDIENTSGYTLRLSASNTTRNSATYTYYNQDEGKSLFYNISPSASIDNGDKTPETEGFERQTLNMTKDGVVIANDGTTPAISSPLLSLQLVDNVDNSSNDYYNAHLSKADTLQIELRSQPEQWNTYTINLIINYVKGPTHSGNITVANCALPGEYIRINKGVTIDADESFAQNGEFFRIGKLNNTGDALEEGYYTFDTSGEKTSEVLKDKVYVDTEGRYVMIPAYYFMNGYGVQYVYTCNNMSDNSGNPIAFPVSFNAETENKLHVHNYHHMKPDTPFKIDLRLQEAIARAMKEDGSFAEPRIYIRNVADMQAFQQFVDTVGVDYPTVNLPGYMDTQDSSKPEEIDVPKYGEYAQFFLQNNVTVQQTSDQADGYYPAPAQFKGTFNGDGNIVHGIDNNLIGNLTGHVYNLGLTTGSIAAEKADGGTIHTSFQYQDKKVFDMSGASKEYTAEEFSNGTVAYNLNQYYLEARKKMIEAPSTTQAALAEVAAVKYVHDYYANGDYQYARQYNATTGKEYLRTNANPHYYVDISTGFDTYTTYHNTEHAIDNARKVNVSIPNSLWTALTEEETESGQMSLSASFVDNGVTSMATDGAAIYEPLFNAAKIDATSGATVVKNDYIFFGQGLQAEPEDYPSAIVSHDVNDMTNRVWRASGFYRTKVDQGFHFNASSDHEVVTYVHDARTTAIDFTGKRDTENAAAIAAKRTGMLEAATQNVFYAPSLDLPATNGYHHLDIDESVTRNLLIYTGNGVDAANSIAKLTKDATSASGKVVNYSDETAENKILAHQVTTDGSTYTAAKLHLVDMEDFNAPIAFTATKAWYERMPETGYVETPGKAWSSVSLPYDVQTATLSDGITRYQDGNGNGTPSVGTAVAPQTEISFFYGSDDAATSDRTHTILNHEFWLRSLNAVTTSGTKKAQFKRPVRSIDGKLNDTDESPSGSGFAAYKPFIVSFPGSRFYEFDMTDQTITFGATDANIAVTDDATTYDERNGYKHYAAFLNNEGTGVYAIDINGEGDKFEAGKTVYPFRTYLTTGSALTPNSMNADFNADGFILISDDLSKLEEVMDGDIDRDPDGGVSTPSGLHVYGVGQRIVVVSDFATTLPVYTVTGALVRVLDVRPGTATYSGFKQGVYVVDRKKIRLR